MASQETPTVGRVTLHNSEYSRSSKELIEFVGQLRALGAHYDLELPRVVVIGNQSAGKSSLVEAISGISVPRDAGTCTRCPMECRLSYSTGEWSCQVKIRYEYNETGKRLEEVEEVDFGPRLTEKTQVEPTLRRAQSAVLRPMIPRATFLEDDFLARIKAVQPLKFSKNVVCVELTGPELVDLSFVDLPGIVQNAEADIVQLVEDMVNSYIQGNSLILLTLPMSDDIENQKAARLAHLADPQGLRTIGVMTKPDTLSAGSTKTRDMWLEVLEGRRHPLLHGYYCTRQPDDDERVIGVSGAAAREAEMGFFREVRPWASSQHQHCLGTTNLVQNVSKLLTQIIRESLPGLLGHVAGQLEACKAQLEMLPPEITTEPSAFVLTLVTTFAANLRASIEGKSGCHHTELVRRTRRTYEAFKHAIRSSAPPFVPYKNAALSPRDVSEYIWIDSRDKTRNGRATSGSEDEEEEDVMYLEDVRRHIKASVTRELPGNVPYTAKTALIQAFQQTWEDAALECFQAVQKTFADVVASAVHAEFGRYSNLKAVIGPSINELMGSCATATSTQICTILALETSPFTQNGHYLVECRDKWLAKYKDARAGKGVAERVTPAAPPVPISAFSFGAEPQASPTCAWGSTKTGSSSDSSTAVTAPVMFGSAVTDTQDRLQASSGWGRGPKTPLSKNQKKASQKKFGKGGDRAPTPPERPVMPSTPSSWTTRASPAKDSINGVGAGVNTADKEQLADEALAILAKLGYTGLTENDLGRLNKADEYEDEIQLMAEVRAYFQVAYKRVIDYIPLTIDHGFLYAFANKLNEQLVERLGLGKANAPARCSAYLAEDPGVVATRDDLLAKRKRLENVQCALHNFGL